jgi:hypothetical protein
MTVARVVVAYLSRLGTPMLAHEKVTLEAVAKAVAQLKRHEFGGWHDNARRYSSGIFFVPDDTLMPDEAASLGIRSPNDLFGGVVSHPFVKTKAITHPLVSNSADRPVGWSSVFAERVRDVVLPGYTAFSARDARVAAERLLPNGLIRLKSPCACGSRGQMPITKTAELEAFLENCSPDEMSTYGLVLELNLRKVVTLSVGQITIDDMVISYHGTQRLTKDNEGRPVYGGSDLVCVPGGWQALAELPMPAGLIRSDFGELAINVVRKLLKGRHLYAHRHPGAAEKHDVAVAHRTNEIIGNVRAVFEESHSRTNLSPAGANPNH